MHVPWRYRFDFLWIEAAIGRNLATRFVNELVEAALRPRETRHWPIARGRQHESIWTLGGLGRSLGRVSRGFAPRFLTLAVGGLEQFEGKRR
jgi:hypothetical protein